MDRILDRPWVAKHARWFIENVEQTIVRNDPPADGAWDELADFYYEEDGRWDDEHLLVQADYVVRVTDAAWIRHLKPGMAWGETFYSMEADNPRPEDLPRVPNVHEPVLLAPGIDGPVRAAAFSPDGSRLYVANLSTDIHVIDPATGTVVDTIVRAAAQVDGLAVSPDGAYLATIGASIANYSAERGSEVCLRRLSDGEVILRHWPGADLTQIAWSPDDRWLALTDSEGTVRLMPMGLPAEPPAGLFAG